jgi:hypothetical protein
MNQTRCEMYPQPFSSSLGEDAPKPRRKEMSITNDWAILQLTLIFSHHNSIPRSRSKGSMRAQASYCTYTLYSQFQVRTRGGVHAKCSRAMGWIRYIEPRDEQGVWSKHRPIGDRHTAYGVSGIEVNGVWENSYPFGILGTLRTVNVALSTSLAAWAVPNMIVVSSNDDTNLLCLVYRTPLSNVGLC